jgi:hypothetical protein
LTDPATLGIAAGIALGVWLVVVALFAVATRARDPDAGPATMELGGDEPPAVVNLITNGWAVGKEAVPATLIDLAARKVVAFERLGPERFVVRMRDRQLPALTSYERQVYDHIRGLQHGGVVPCEALTTGPQDESKKWWKKFKAAVSDDARSRGLSRNRWGRGHLAVMGALATAPALLASGAFVALPDTSTSSKSEDPGVLGFLFFAFIVWTALMFIPRSLRAERDTPEGLAVASRWLGLRAQLAGDEAFGDQPPAAVAIWDRLLSYGAAMGVAAGAVRALPMGTESERNAWTAYGGHWKLVRVHYPNRFPPGWGRSPATAIAIGLAILVPAGLIAYGLGDLLSSIWHEVQRAVTGLGAALGSAIALAFLCAPLAALAYGGVMLWSGVTDAGKRMPLEGLVLRRKEITSHNDSGTHTDAVYLAVYDGNGTEVRALRCTPQVASGVGPGAEVRATISPKLFHVYAVERVSGPSQPA